MRALRRVEVDTAIFRVGDQIRVGHYTATCQKVEADGYIFLLDQYLDEAMPMKRGDYCDDVRYEMSDLRRRLNSGEIMIDFNRLRDRMIPFDNGDLLRLPFYGEIFGRDEWCRIGRVEHDDYEQWELMKDRKNRIAERKGDDDVWGWVQNKRNGSTTLFYGVDYDGYSNSWSTSFSLGVRPVFIIGRKIGRVE